MVGSTIGGFRVLDEIGRGGMGVVYRALTEKDGDAAPVALKVILPEIVAEPEVFDRFWREATIGISVQHENVVRTHEVGQEPGDDPDRPIHFMVMELVDGQTLRQLSEEIGEVAEGLLLDIARQVARGLEAIHAQGVVHRDLKPDNVIITDTHQVKIMDLGVAKLDAETAKLTRTGHFVGSLQYAAPEQFTRPDDVDGKADLFALGILLYELATTRNPFEGDSLPETLRALMESDPPPLRSLNGRVSAFLEAIVAALLRKDAAERIPSATELASILDAGEDSDWWREAGRAAVAEVATETPPRPRSTRPVPLQGRDDEVEVVLEAWRRTKEEGGRLVLLRGPAGIGLSALAETALDRIDESEETPSTTAGRALARGRALLPFVEALEHLFRVDELPAADRHAHLAKEVARLHPEMAGMAPSLAAWILGSTTEGASGSDLTRDALHSALAALFRQLALRAPLALHLDDLHRADRETISFLPYFLRSMSKVPLLVVACLSEAVAHDEVAEELWSDTLQWLGTEERSETRNVAPLDEEAVESVLRVRFRSERFVAELAPILCERAGGIPFRLFAILDEMEKQGVLRRTEHAWQTQFNFQVPELPESVAGVLRMKLAGLDEEDRQVLDVAAVIGHRFDATLLAKALEMKRIPLLTRLARLERGRGLIRSDGAAFEYADGLFHEIVYGEVPPLLRSAYHAQIADVLMETLEGQDLGDLQGKQAYALSDHLIRAERGDEAGPYLSRALEFLGHTLRTVDGAELAEQGLEALTGSDPQSKKHRLDVLLGARRFLNLLGRRDREQELMQQALELARELEDPAAESRVQLFLSGLLQATGHHEDANEAGEESLRLAETAQDPAAEADARMAIGVARWRKGLLGEARPFFERALEIRREITDRRGTGAALANLGVLHQRSGESAEARQRYEEARAVFEEIGDRRSEAAVLNNLGTMARDEGLLDEALSLLRAALKRKCEVGDRLGERVTLRNLAAIYTERGLLEDALREFEGAIDIARDIGHTSGEAESLEGLTSLLTTLGDHATAVERGEEAVGLAARLGEARTEALALRSLGCAHLSAGELDRARECLEESLELQTADPRLRLEALTDLVWVEAEAERQLPAATRLGEAEPIAQDLDVEAFFPILKGLGARIAALGDERNEAERLARSVLEGESEPSAVAHAVLALRSLGIAPAGPALVVARAVVEETARAITDEATRERYLRNSWPARVLA